MSLGFSAASSILWEAGKNVQHTYPKVLRFWRVKQGIALIISGVLDFIERIYKKKTHCQCK